MGIDVAALMGLMTGGGNLMGQMGNLSAQKMGMANAIWDAARYFQRNSDPTIQDIRNYNVNRFNDNQYGPYGDVGGSFGNMWGTRADGSPVQFGDMAAAQTNYMLNNNPANAALAQLQMASNMQRPQMPTGIDIMSGDASRAGTGNWGMNSRPQMPMQSMAPTMPSSYMTGVAAPQGPNPTISSPTPGPGTQIRQNISDIRAGQGATLPQLPLGGQGTQGMGSLASQFINANGGPMALLQALRQPGNALTNLRQFSGAPGHLGGSPGYAGGGNPYADFWNTHGKDGGNGMRSYAVGTPYVQKTGPAMLHQGEAVIPRQANPFMGQAGGQMGQMPPRFPRPFPAQQAPSPSMPPRPGGYDPTRGVPVGGQSFGKAPMGPAQGQPHMAPPQQMGQSPYSQQFQQMLDQRSNPYQVPTGAQQNLTPQMAQTGGGSIDRQYTTQGPLQAQAQFAKTNPTLPLQSSAVGKQGGKGNKVGKKGNRGNQQSGGINSDGTVGTQGGGQQSGGMNSGTSQGTTGQTPVPPAPIDQGRVDLVQNLLANPESMSQAWQDVANKQFADQYDAQNQDMMRQARERLGASGLGDSGIAQDQAFRAGLARQSNLLGAKRDIAQQAALTNFNDRQQVANLALQHQLGIGNLGLQNAAFQNDVFNSDRNYQTQLANMMMNFGMQGQGQQSNLLGQLGGLVGSGLGYNDQLLNLIYGQGMQRYASPDVSAVQQYSYAPNPYLDYLSAQNQGGGGSDMSGLYGALGSAVGGFAGSDAGSQLIAGLFK